MTPKPTKAAVRKAMRVAFNAINDAQWLLSEVAPNSSMWADSIDARRQIRMLRVLCSVKRWGRK